MPAFDTLTLQQVTEALGKRGLDTDAITEALDFYNGDHWRGGQGWMGQVPPNDDPNRAAVMDQIRCGFVSENTVKEIVDRHTGGVLGREPAWDYVLRRPLADDAKPTPDEQTLLDEADAIMTSWWDKRKPHAALMHAVHLALLAKRATLRIYVPRGLLDDNKKLSRSTIEEALDTIRIHVPGVTQDDVLTTAALTGAGIIRDPATEAECGVMTATDAEQASIAETTFLTPEQQTVVRIIATDGAKYESQPFELGGRLFMYELRREHLITPQVRQDQKALNLAVTKMLRNINVAGDAEVTYLNAEPPMVTVADASAPGGTRQVPGRLAVGAGARVFVQGTAIRDDQNNIINRLNPALSYREPVEIKTFVGTRAECYTMMLNQTHQTHALIAGDATASGISRVQARADFESDLTMTKSVVDDALRWMLETVLAFAACIVGQPQRYAGLRVEANTIVDSGPLSPEERAANRDDHDAGLLSAETAMSRNGVDDVTAESERIGREKEQAAEIAARAFNAGSVPVGA